ncbi:MAG: hypothetical protein Ct9H300mP21_09920 [Pseudomonadota bacterium]|nr:MAG: hypothetical protein Ct9H300mP21_09920 [Pseudomonadota bacterium]
MRYETFIGKRYLFSPRRDLFNFSNHLDFIGGVALGVVALIVATSVMNGFPHKFTRCRPGFPYRTSLCLPGMTR